MSKKDNFNDQNEPWDQPIYETEYDENLSRTQQRRDKKGNSLFITLLVLLLVTLTVGVFATYFWIMRPTKKVANTEETTTTSLVSTTTEQTSSQVSSTSTSEVSTTTTSSETTPSSSSEAPVEEAQTPETPTENANTQTNTNTENNTATENQTPTETAGSSYTVQAGDSLYRIAVSNGLSLDELLSLNGLNSSSTIHPGQTLKVK